MSKKTTTETNGNTQKVFAVKLSPELHSALVSKCTEHGVSLQSLGEQLVELFLSNGVELKVNIAVSRDMAALLADPKLSAEVLAAFKAKSTKKAS